MLVVTTSQSRLTTGMSDLVAAVNKEGGKRQTVSKEDAIKLLGCWDALADPNTTGVAEDRPTGRLASGSGRGHLNTAIAFTNTVNLSKAIAGPSDESPGLWQGVAAEASTETDTTALLDMAVEHVDGSTPAITRATRLDRLRDDPQQGTCRVISNARVLTEGVDVPALDAVVFLQPRKSKIDIVQAVGRVMRTYPGKQTRLHRDPRRGARRQRRHRRRGARQLRLRHRLGRRAGAALPRRAHGHVGQPHRRNQQVRAGQTHRPLDRPAPRRRRRRTTAVRAR